MKTVTILKGLPASGKSTWARARLLKKPGQYIRVNKDECRTMLHAGRWSRDNEKFVLRLRDHLICEGLNAGKHVIVDDTNLHPKHEERIRQIVREYNRDNGDGVQVQVESFDAPLDECIKRDAKRANGVGEAVIRGMWRRYVKPKPVPVAMNPENPRAVVCDLDGTLAILNGRDPYEPGDAILDDERRWSVKAVLDAMSIMRHRVILVSGRSSDYRKQTEQWLERHDVRYESLFMRESGDNRKDAIIKREILEQDIAPNWNVTFVLDDRKQVVDMWRDAGLECWQVAPGDF